MTNGAVIIYFLKNAITLFHIDNIIRQSRNSSWLQKVLKEPVWLQTF